MHDVSVRTGCVCVCVVCENVGFGTDRNNALLALNSCVVEQCINPALPPICLIWPTKPPLCN